MKTFFGFHPRIRENPRIFRSEDLFFLNWCLPKHSWNFAMTTFVFWSTLSNSKNSSFCAAQKIIYAPQSRYPGAGPAIDSKTLAVPYQPPCRSHFMQSIIFSCIFTLIDGLRQINVLNLNLGRKKQY